ncbi:hypothetical protein E2C01_009141 [Portunus trituberculatus]|uniref:Uncharacterized protein n=1 Tax=Portunus trituberculatus TaxID=210409 RepID=A0A5B7D3V9_PORTR|nr:hypothetical protein [Portunus trituberculatus]
MSDATRRKAKPTNMNEDSRIRHNGCQVETQTPDPLSLSSLTYRLNSCSGTVKALYTDEVAGHCICIRQGASTTVLDPRMSS